MNILLEIGRDKDIVLKTLPSNKEVEAFAEERGLGPILNRMHFCFKMSQPNIPGTLTWPTSLLKVYEVPWS